jgi:hypothetical protein
MGDHVGVRVALATVARVDIPAVVETVTPVDPLFTAHVPPSTTATKTHAPNAYIFAFFESIFSSPLYCRVY